MDVVMLSRIQFAVTVIYHFLFVPFSIGLGLVMALAEHRYYKSGDERDKAAADFWIKIFTATFAVGVATGISMEFAFGMNWATYSRFMGDVFGPPLAAEALLAFFLESVFLGVLIFGRTKVSKKVYHTSAWLVWAGTLLSALWIIIANSWMQTPAGYKVIGEGLGRKAVLTDFFAAAFNPSTLPRYLHTIDAVLMVGGFSAMAIAAYYLRRGTHGHFAKRTMATGVAIALASTILMLPMGHLQAVSVANTQPSKIAAFEGHWNDGPMPLGLIGYVDEANGKTVALQIPGMVNILTGDFARTRSFAGLNSFEAADRPPLQLTYQTYHFMSILWGLMLLLAIVTWWQHRKKTLEDKRGLLGLLVWSPLLPMLAIQLGWASAEVGRQPWIVWGELRTVDAISKAVPAGEVLLSLVLFTVFYTIIYIAWARVVLGIIKKGPELAEKEPAAQPGPVPEGVA
ncbi:MAG: cytochrome ubiquinol oxidase subunit I [Coriobacteriales bacterium]